MVTREQLPSLSEDLLRREILIPLFTAMGYQDVFHHHGGSLEQGKDITMWKQEGFRPRVNYAVVVKKGNLNGRASGGGSAGEVQTQVHQCFGAPFKDSVTGEDQNVHKCLVVASGVIPKEFTNAVHGPLSQSGLDRVTDFYDGDKLFPLIEKHLPQKAPSLAEIVKDVQSFMSGKMPEFVTTITASKEESLVSVKPIKPDATSVVAGTISFSAKDKSAQKLEEQYEQFLKTGEPFTIQKDELSEMEFPDFVTRIWGLSPEKIAAIQIGPQKFDPVKFTICRRCLDGDQAELSNIELAVIKAGTEEATLTNEHQDVPWSFTVVIRNNHSMRFSYKASLTGRNVKPALDWLLFQRALAKPGQIIMQRVETGLENETLADSGYGEVPDAYLLDLVERLALIQKRTGKILTVPAVISENDERSIDHLFAVVTTGRVSLEQMSFTLKKGAVRRAGQSFDKPGALHVNLDKADERTCLGVHFELGPTRIVCSGAQLTGEAAKEFALELQRGSDDDDIAVTFGATKDRPIELLYTNWLKE